MKNIEYDNGVPVVTWTQAEVNRMNIIENLQYAIIGIFSFG